MNDPDDFDYAREVEDDDREFIAEMFGGMQYDDRCGDDDNIDSSVDGTAIRYGTDFFRESMR